MHTFPLLINVRRLGQVVLQHNVGCQGVILVIPTQLNAFLNVLMALICVIKKTIIQKLHLCTSCALIMLVIVTVYKNTILQLKVNSTYKLNSICHAFDNQSLHCLNVLKCLLCGLLVWRTKTIFKNLYFIAYVYSIGCYVHAP